MRNYLQEGWNNPSKILCFLMRKTARLWRNDETYLKVYYYFALNKKLNLSNPQTMNEKTQWLKLYNRNPLYSTLVDKYAVKDYVTKILGDEYIIPTIGVWDRPEDIDFNGLPDKFVLKTTHGGGNCGVVVCKDKSTFDCKKAIAQLNKSLRQDLYLTMREWPYKNVPKRIIAEQFLSEQNGGSIVDYKFYCFNGKVDVVLLCTDRDTGNTKFYFFDRGWNLKRYNKLGKSASEGFTLPKPNGMDDMFAIAEKLSVGFPFVRVDLYNVNGKIYFGELTFFPNGGFDNGRLPETDLHFGNLIDLNKVNIRK